MNVTRTELEQRRVGDVQRLQARGAPALPELLEMLAEPSWTVRREVVAALADSGAEAVEPLCNLLRWRRDDETRLAAAVDALVASRAEVYSSVARLAAEAEPMVVADAVQILGRRRESRAVSLLARLVEHADDNVAVSAIEALGRIGGRSAVDVLVASLASGNFFRVFPAIDVLGRSGDPRAIGPLARLLDQPLYLFEAARALGKTGEAGAVAPLVRLLDRGSEAVVRVAAVATRELFVRHQERHGNELAVEEALRRAAPGPQAIRPLARALANAEADEKAAIAFLLGIMGGEVAVAALNAMLDAEGEPARIAAASLKRLGRVAESQIRAALRDGGSARRLLLLPVVGRPSAAQDLVACLDDPDARVRASACDAIARVGATGALEALFARLADSHPRVAQSALAAIQSLGTDRTVDLAVRAFRDGGPAVRRAALRILGYFGAGESLPVFLDAVADPDERLQETALAGLAFLDDPRALDVLLEAARSPSDKARSAAMRALGQCARRDPRLVSALLQGLRDSDPWVRYYACQALGRIGDKTTLRPVASMLADSAGQVRVAAIEALASFRDDAAFEALRAAAAAEDADIRRAALIGLGVLQRPETIPILLEAARSADPASRLVAVSALADSGSAAALAVLAQAARDPDENVRTAAIGFLAAAPGWEPTQTLVELLADPGERERVVSALAVPSDGRVPGLLAALEAADDDLAPLLVSALARMRTPEGTDALYHAFSLESSAARRAAATAIAALGTRRGLDALRRAAEEDPDPYVRQVCAVLLAG